MFLQESSGVRRSARGDIFGRARGHDFAAGVAAFGPEIDDVIGRLDHVDVMLDQEHGVPGIHQSVQRREQPLDVGQMQAGGRLVEDVDACASTAAACSARTRS